VTLASLARQQGDWVRVKARLNFSLVLVLMLMSAWAAPVAFSQEGERGAARFYNPNAETTVKGTVEEVETAYLPGGGAGRQAKGKFSGPIYLKLKADSGMLTVYLGPSWFLAGCGKRYLEGPSRMAIATYDVPTLANITE
jgi:hypothetical protein